MAKRKKNVSYNPIESIKEDWGLDARNGFPYSGESIQKFIKESLNGKAGLFYYDTSNNRYLVFTDEQTRDEYLADTTKTELIIGTFDAPFNYSAEIHLGTPLYNAVFFGSVGNYIDFTFDVKNKQGASTGENVTVTYTFIRNSIKKVVRENRKFGESVHFNVDQFLGEGTNVVTIGIVGKYVDLKFEEANLKCKLLMKKEEEKEEIRRREQEIKEQLKLEEEINKAKEKIQYEQTQFNTEIARLQEQLANEQGNKKTIMNQLKKLQDKLAKLEEKKKDVLNRQINKKAGWVYVISNDSFEGKEVYKVGTTRRLEPLTRIAELSSASVPFKFKVNSIIFSEDCFGLETALHRALDNKRWNLVNKHKEFFVCSLNEIKQEVLKHNPTATFIDNPIDDEYKLSKEMV